jgi:hypothetical protein
MRIDHRGNPRCRSHSKPRHRNSFGSGCDIFLGEWSIFAQQIQCRHHVEGRNFSSSMQPWSTHISIEDGFGEDDWEGFRAHTAMLGHRVQIVGDDLYATNPILIRRGVEERATNCALIKLNQIGTISETIKAIDICRQAGWRYVISHRSLRLRIRSSRTSQLPWKADRSKRDLCPVANDCQNTIG